MTKFGGVPNIHGAHAVFRLGKPSFKKENLFDNQLRVWVYENESRILMHFQTSHTFVFSRIATFSIFSCQKMLFIDDQTFPGTHKQHFTV